jgi:hypothetical protein
LLTYEFTLLASLPLGKLQALLITANSDDASLLLERVADGAGADLSVLQVAITSSTRTKVAEIRALIRVTSALECAKSGEQKPLLMRTMFPSRTAVCSEGRVADERWDPMIAYQQLAVGEICPRRLAEWSSGKNRKVRLLIPVFLEGFRRAKLLLGASG